MYITDCAGQVSHGLARRRRSRPRKSAGSASSASTMPEEARIGVSPLVSARGRKRNALASLGGKARRKLSRFIAVAHVTPTVPSQPLPPARTVLWPAGRQRALPLGVGKSSRSASKNRHSVSVSFTGFAAYLVP